jgi:hypothetical protein
VAGLLDAGLEAQGERVDVVAQGLGRAAELLVG